MDEYEHAMVNHLETYVDSNVHANGIENFWSLLKRTIGGNLREGRAIFTCSDPWMSSTPTTLA
jgi:hypothetical protein